MPDRGVYELVSSGEGPAVDGSLQKPRRRGFWRHPITILMCTFVVLLVLGLPLKVLALRLWSRVVAGGSCDSVDGGFVCQPEISHSWGQYSPFFSVPSDISPAVPDGCSVSFVQVLSRHGARDPTASKTTAYRATIAKIQRGSHFTGPYAFLGVYNFSLGADMLTAFGQQEMVNSGVHFYNRYENLAKDATPFVRASGQVRVVESAQNFTQGYHQARLADRASTGPDSFPYAIITIAEGAENNNTLNNNLCASFEDGPFASIGHAAQSTWLDVFAPSITARLNNNLPGTNLNSAETINLMDMCPFDTVASSSGQISPFCGLFTEDEWQQYDYYQSLGKYYGYGNGNPLGPTQGIGYANELIARMTNTPVRDVTSVNHTLDRSNATFPLGKALYADFSHDNDMIPIFSVLGLFNSTTDLSNTTISGTNVTKDYRASFSVPFAGRAYFEKMRCHGADEEFVRILLNDKVLPLDTCGGDSLGRCALGRFVESLGFARDGGKWAQCFG